MTGWPAALGSPARRGDRLPPGPPAGLDPGPRPFSTPAHLADEPVKVTLHVYDIGVPGHGGGSRGGVAAMNKLLRLLGTGAFHCGIEIHGREWSFRATDVGTGIFWEQPRRCLGHTYRESVPMGEIRLSEGHVLRLLKLMEGEWWGITYDTLTRNCCHFSDELCQLLGVGSIPAWTTSLASTGDALMRTGKRLGCKGSFLCMPSDDFLGLQPRSPSPRAFGSPNRARFGASPGSFLASPPRFRGGENRGGENRAPSGRSWREEDSGQDAYANADVANAGRAAGAGPLDCLVRCSLCPDAADAAEGPRRFAGHVYANADCAVAGEDPG